MGNAIQVASYHSRKPTSACKCGHTGDGANSSHNDSLALGHGSCRIKDCQCKRFTWSHWLPDFEKLLKE